MSDDRRLDPLGLLATGKAWLAQWFRLPLLLQPVYAKPQRRNVHSRRQTTRTARHIEV